MSCGNIRIVGDFSFCANSLESRRRFAIGEMVHGQKNGSFMYIHHNHIGHYIDPKKYNFLVSAKSPLYTIEEKLILLKDHEWAGCYREDWSLSLTKGDEIVLHQEFEEFVAFAHVVKNPNRIVYLSIPKQDVQSKKNNQEITKYSMIRIRDCDLSIRTFYEEEEKIRLSVGQIVKGNKQTGHILVPKANDPKTSSHKLWIPPDCLDVLEKPTSPVYEPGSFVLIPPRYDWSGRIYDIDWRLESWSESAAEVSEEFEDCIVLKHTMENGEDILLSIPKNHVKKFTGESGFLRITAEHTPSRTWSFCCKTVSIGEVVRYFRTTDLNRIRIHLGGPLLNYDNSCENYDNSCENGEILREASNPTNFVGRYVYLKTGLSWAGKTKETKEWSFVSLSTDDPVEIAYEFEDYIAFWHTVQKKKLLLSAHKNDIMPALKSKDLAQYVGSKITWGFDYGRGVHLLNGDIVLVEDVRDKVVYFRHPLATETLTLPHDNFKRVESLPEAINLEKGEKIYLCSPEQHRYWHVYHGFPYDYYAIDSSQGTVIDMIGGLVKFSTKDCAHPLSIGVQHVLSNKPVQNPVIATGLSETNRQSPNLPAPEIKESGDNLHQKRNLVQWEYKTWIIRNSYLSISDENEKQLSAFGDEGWELCGIESQKVLSCYFFRRPKNQTNTKETFLEIIAESKTNTQHAVPVIESNKDYIGYMFYSSRQETGETVEEIANILGLSPDQWNDLESGKVKPTRDILMNLFAHYLDYIEKTTSAIRVDKNEIA